MNEVEPVRRTFSKEERQDRAARRVAVHIRELWEETGGSNTRLLDSLLYPDICLTVGRSVKCEDKGHREHVVPRLVIIKECLAMLELGKTDDELAQFIREHTKIVLISREEQQRLDGSKVGERGLGLRQKMPEEWKAGDDIFARLSAAGIVWRAIESGPS